MPPGFISQSRGCELDRKTGVYRTVLYMDTLQGLRARGGSQSAGYVMHVGGIARVVERWNEKMEVVIRP